MTDKSARTKFAELIRQLAAGLITNDQFEDRLPQNVDHAIHEVYFNGVWGLYSDLYEYRLVGKHSVPKEARRVLGRFILFLKSDLEYKWPRQRWWEFLLSLA